MFDDVDPPNGAKAQWACPPYWRKRRNRPLWSCLALEKFGSGPRRGVTDCSVSHKACLAPTQWRVGSRWRIWSSSVKIVELAGETLCSRGDCWDLGRTNSPTSARRGDGLEFIRIWATPPIRLVFWDGAPSPSTSNREKRKLRWRGKYQPLQTIIIVITSTFGNYSTRFESSEFIKDLISEITRQ